MKAGLFFRLLVMVAALALIMSSQATRLLAGTTGEISGYITDAASGAPIAGAQVSAVASSGSYKAASNSRGYFAMLNVIPDTYAVTASASGYQSGSSLGNTVNQDQNTSVQIALTKEVRSLGRVTVRSAVSVVQPNIPADQYTLNAQAVNATNGAGGNSALYQTPGVVGVMPGVTVDASGYPHIRGGRLEELGYEYDGITTVEPITGTFSTNLVNDGLSRVEVSTGGYPSPGGNAISGIVNTVVQTGSYPGRGDATFLAESPTFYHGIVLNYGNGTPDNRFTYFLGGVWWNSDYDWGQRGQPVPGAESLETAYGSGTLNRVNPSRDQVLNLHYRLGSDNDLQFLTTNGIEHYDYNTLIPTLPFWPNMSPLNAALVGNPGPAKFFDPATGLCSPNPGGGGFEFGMFPGQVACNQSPGASGNTDHDDQGYFISKLQFTHNFGSNSFLQLRYARVGSYVTFFFPFDGCAFCDVWENRHSDQQEVMFEYDTQLNSQNLIKLGGGSDYSHNYLAEVLPSNGFGEVIPTPNHDFNFYLYDQFKPFDRLTLDLSGREDIRQYLTVTQPAFSDHSFQGRAGFAFQATPSTVLRGSYGNFVELPYVSRIERIVTFVPNFMDISPANQIELLDAQPEIPQNHSYDFALEQEFGHGISLKVDPFWRNTTNLVLTLHQPNRPLGLPQAVGPYYVNGIETEIQFNRGGGQGWSGFIDYTHTRALSAVTGDYSQSVPLGVYLAHALFPANFIPPNVGNLVATYRWRGWTVNPNIEYVGGYPYGVGRLTYASDGSIVQNPAAYWPGSNVLLDPAESKFADGRVCCTSIVVNFNLYYDLTKNVQVGVQMQNLNHEYRQTALEQNPYFPFSPFGPAGFNGFYNYGATPYMPAAINSSQEFLFTVTTKM